MVRDFFELLESNLRPSLLLEQVPFVPGPEIPADICFSLAQPWFIALLVANQGPSGTDNGLKGRLQFRHKQTPVYIVTPKELYRPLHHLLDIISPQRLARSHAPGELHLGSSPHVLVVLVHETSLGAREAIIARVSSPANSSQQSSAETAS